MLVIDMCCIITITLIQCVFNSYDVLHNQQLLCVASQKSIKLARWRQENSTYAEKGLVCRGEHL